MNSTHTIQTDMTIHIPVNHTDSNQDFAGRVHITFDPLKGFATVLSKPTGYYLIDGVTGRTLLHATPGNPRIIYTLANQRGLKLVNEGSNKGKTIMERLHSHARKTQKGL